MVASLGEVELHLLRRRREWWVLSSPRSSGSQSVSGWQPFEPFDQQLLEQPGRVLGRHLFTSAPSAVRVTPGLADRPMVIRPTSPTRIGPGEEAEVFVGSPVWIRIEADELTLAEVPAERPSDTWFGSSTRSGQLCYAARSRARLNLDNLSAKEDRVVTPTKIRNQCDEPLDLDRWSLPVEFLSIYQGEAGWLWTEAVTLTREHPEHLAKLEIESGPPERALSHEPLSTSRKQMPSDSRFLAFGARAIGALLRAP